jgi:hypothetical protein
MATREGGEYEPDLVRDDGQELGLGLRGRLGHLLLLFQRRVPPGQLLALAFLLKGTRMRQADLDW